jgi:hypothetical protein
MAGGALGTILLGVLPFPILPALPIVMLVSAIIGLGIVLLGAKRG